MWSRGVGVGAVSCQAGHPAHASLCTRCARWSLVTVAHLPAAAADPPTTTQPRHRPHTPPRLARTSCSLLVFLVDNSHLVSTFVCCLFAFSALTSWLGGRKGIRPVKKQWWGAGVVICLERGADSHLAQLMPLPLTVSCFSEIQTGSTFLVPTYPGSPGQRAVKRVCVCVCVSTFVLTIFIRPQTDRHRQTDSIQQTSVQLLHNTHRANTH